MCREEENNKRDIENPSRNPGFALCRGVACCLRVCFSLSSVLVRQDTERHEEKKERKSGKERNEPEQVGEKEKKLTAKERNEQASIPYVRVSAQQREIKHRSVTKTAETLSLLVQQRE